MQGRSLQEIFGTCLGLFVMFELSFTDHCAVYLPKRQELVQVKGFLQPPVVPFNSALIYSYTIYCCVLSLLVLTFSIQGKDKEWELPANYLI
jgi:hypothetical protein